MVEQYSLENLNLREIKALRVGLDSLTIQGIDAMFMALLQTNIQTQINQIEEHIRLESLPPSPPITQNEPTPPDEVVVSKKKK